MSGNESPDEEDPPSVAPPTPCPSATQAQRRIPGVKVSLPECSGQHAKHVTWRSKFVPRLVMMVGLTIISLQGRVNSSRSQEEDEILLFILTQALSGRAARIARKHSSGVAQWLALQTDFSGAAAEKLQAALLRLRAVKWKNENHN